jgi:hypothetical protein
LRQHDYGVRICCKVQVVAAWNGMAISAFARASRALAGTAGQTGADHGFPVEGVYLDELPFVMKHLAFQTQQHSWLGSFGHLKCCRACMQDTMHCQYVSEVMKMLKSVLLVNAAAMVVPGNNLDENRC